MAFINPPILSILPFPKLLNAPIALRFVILPIVVSDIIMAYPNVSVSIRYVNKNIPPPYFAAKYGNLQILPSPTAEPATANMYPS